MKDQKKVWSRRQFINSAVAGMAGIAVIPQSHRVYFQTIRWNYPAWIYRNGSAIDVPSEWFYADPWCSRLLPVVMFMVSSVNVLKNV